MRLAAYEAVLAKTGDELQAVYAAKNVTVNFNKRGETGAQLGAIQLFYNPTVRGGYTIYHAITKGAHRRQLHALLAAAATLGYLMAAAGDDNEDLAGVSDYEKSRNIIIPLGGGKRLNIPMPYGYSWFYNMGQYTYELQRDRDLGTFALHAALSLQDNFSPWKLFDETGAHPVELVPTEPAKMWIRLDTNRTALGGTIYPEAPFDPGIPDSAKMFRGTVGSFYDDVTRSVNEATGGSISQPGAISVSPETLRFWWDSLTGGAGAFAEASLGLARLLATEPSAVEPRDIPIARKLYKESTTGELRNRFYTALRKAREADSNLNRAVRMQDVKGERIAELRARAADTWLEYLEAEQDALRTLNEDRLEIMRNPKFSIGEKRLRLKALENEENAIYKDALQDMPKSMQH
jgi:hypothetical protein